jgi:hypothetical protein
VAPQFHDPCAKRTASRGAARHQRVERPTPACHDGVSCWAAQETQRSGSIEQEHLIADRNAGHWVGARAAADDA